MALALFVQILRTFPEPVHLLSAQLRPKGQDFPKDRQSIFALTQEYSAIHSQQRGATRSLHKSCLSSIICTIMDTF